MKNFVEQISIKFRGQDKFGSQMCCRQAHQDIGRNSYICR